MANFVIAGTEKAGTTSIFTYLSEHPEVCGSKVKETDFFRFSSDNDSAANAATYRGYFECCKGGERVFMEASPGYLSGGEPVARRMHGLIPGAKLLFVLRNPVDRLYSSFNFHMGKLDLPAELNFEEYVEKCLAFEAGEATVDELGIGEWYLRAISHGQYASFLDDYFRLYPRDQIRVMFYEDLKDDPASFMRKLCGFLDITPDFFDGYDFRRVNATFSGRMRWLHRIAVSVNARSEVYLRQRPKLKRALVTAYKRINQAREGYEEISDGARRRLSAYYAPSVSLLDGYVGARQIPWRAWFPSSNGTE